MTEASLAPRVAPRRIHHLIERWVGEQPEALALRDARLVLSYRELDEASRHAAEQLTVLGVRAGDRILIVAENCAALGILLLAASRLDAWSIVANARLSDREIDVIVGHAEPRRVIFTAHVSEDAARHASRMQAKPVHWPGVGELRVGPIQDRTQPEPVFEDPREQVAALIYTSGTSGAPKGVMLTHANIMFTARSAADLRGLSPGDMSYCVLPMAHIVGLATQFVGSLAGGACVLLEPRFSPAEAARVLAEERITTFVGVPAMFARLLEWARETRSALRGPALRFIGVAGSPLTTGLKADVEAAFGRPLHNGYGLTECAPTVAQTRMQAPRADCAVGLPIPGVDIRIVDGPGADVGPGEVGELWVRSPGLMRGYYRDAPATAAAIDAAGWFNTGDMCRLEADGALSIVGRTKELIIRSGLNVYPVEVEQALNSHPDVVQSAVVGRTVGHNEEVVAYIEPAAGRSVSAADLQLYLRERLAPYKVPSEIVFLDRLPAAPTGKVLKKALQTMAQEGAAAALDADRQPEGETR